MRVASRPSPAALLVVAGVAVLVIGIAIQSGWFGPRPGDPSLVANDPRRGACGIPASDTWMAFPMAQAQDFSKHFPGWSAGAEELLTTDPALVVISNGYQTGFGGPALAYNMCIAVGPPTDSLVHHYNGTRFDAIRPSLGGPLVRMP